MWSWLRLQGRQDGGEFRCGFVDFVVGIGFGDDAAAGVGVRRCGGRPTAVRRGWTPPSGRRRAGRTSPPRPRRSRGHPRARAISSAAAAAGTPPTAGVGCSATARSNAVVDVSRSRPVIGVRQVPHRGGAAQLRCRRNLQVDAQRVERLAHRVDDQFVLVAVLGRLGQRRAAGPVGVGVGQSRRRARERCGRPPASPRRATSSSGLAPTSAVPGVLAARGGQVGEVGVGRRVGGRPAGARWCAHPAARRRPTAAPGPAPPCAARCRDRRSRCSAGRDAGAVLVGLGQRLRDPHRAAERAAASRQGVGNCTACGRISAAGLDMSNGNAPKMIGALRDAEGGAARRRRRW